MRKIIISTERLNIIPRDIDELSDLHDKEDNHEMKQAYKEMMDTMLRLPGKEEWGSDWKINLHSGMTIGGICFKGIPDDDGVVEIGYGIDTEYQNQGYATEAVKGISEWALEQKSVKRVIAQTEPQNEISQKVLLNNGFVNNGVGEEGLLFIKSL